jgi:hypothetical protein
MGFSMLACSQYSVSHPAAMSAQQQQATACAALTKSSSFKLGPTNLCQGCLPALWRGLIRHILPQLLQLLSMAHLDSRPLHK